MTKKGKILGLEIRAGALVVALLAAGFAHNDVKAQTADAAPASIVETVTVQGTGTVTAEPDMATIMLGVSDRGATAQDAMDGVSSVMAVIRSDLEGFGIPPRDIQTSQLSIQPLWDEMRDDNGIRQREIVGFEAYNMVTIRVRDLSTFGDVLDELIDQGVNQMNGISFDLSNPQSARLQALAAATADARQQAEVIAQSLGLSLGEVVQASTIPNNDPPMPFQGMRGDMMEIASSVPVSRGEVNYSAQVTIQYLLERD